MMHTVQYNDSANYLIFPLMRLVPGRPAAFAIFKTRATRSRSLNVQQLESSPRMTMQGQPA